MTVRAWACRLVLLGLILLAHKSAQGENMEVETLEWMVADSDVVVVARGVAAGGVADSVGIGTWADVEVEEVVKGDVTPGRLRVWMGPGAGPDVGDAQLMFALKRPDNVRAEIPGASKNKNFHVSSPFTIGTAAYIPKLCLLVGRRSAPADQLARYGTPAS